MPIPIHTFSHSRAHPYSQHFNVKRDVCCSVGVQCEKVGIGMGTRLGRNKTRVYNFRHGSVTAVNMLHSRPVCSLSQRGVTRGRGSDRYDVSPQPT